MLNNNIRRLLILDDDKLVGVLTQTDLTEFLRNKLLVDQTVKNIQLDFLLVSYFGLPLLILNMDL
jgi:signal-transduction protein with cAMP-binding, CBS, and nucleotidyltransferase domain